MNILTAAGAKRIGYPELEGAEVRDIEVVSDVNNLIRANVMVNWVAGWYLPKPVHLERSDWITQ